MIATVLPLEHALCNRRPWCHCPDQHSRCTHCRALRRAYFFFINLGLTAVPVTVSSHRSADNVSPRRADSPTRFVPGPLAQGAFVAELCMTYALLGFMTEDAFLVRSASDVPPAVARHIHAALHLFAFLIRFCCSKLCTQRILTLPTPEKWCFKALGLAQALLV